MLIGVDGEFQTDLVCRNGTLNTLSSNPTEWSNTLKQFVGKLPTNCLSLFDHFVGLPLKGFKKVTQKKYYVLLLTINSFLQSIIY